MKFLLRQNRIFSWGDDVPQAISSFDQVDSLPADIRQCLAQFKIDKPTPIQMQAIPVMLNDRNILACAPTGKHFSFKMPRLIIYSSIFNVKRYIFSCIFRLQNWIKSRNQNINYLRFIWRKLINLREKMKLFLGSGKTLTFAIPILNKINKLNKLKKYEDGTKLFALILEPTKELAAQVGWFPLFRVYSQSEIKWFTVTYLCRVLFTNVFNHLSFLPLWTSDISRHPICFEFHRKKALTSEFYWN